jgi:hypothetical protein
MQDYGKSVNLPIARFGHISRMPSMVNTPRWKGDRFKSPAFLAECLSWGGISGSPVLRFEELHFNREEGIFTQTDVRSLPALIGCVNGFRHKFTKVDTRGDVLGTVKTKLNTGIAVITPAQAIADLLAHPDFVSHRESAFAREQRPANDVSHE